MQSTVVDFIRDYCKQSSKYTEEEILRAIGILSTSGVNQGMVGGHALYPTFSFISHRLVRRIEFLYQMFIQYLDIFFDNVRLNSFFLSLTAAKIIVAFKFIMIGELYFVL